MNHYRVRPQLGMRFDELVIDNFAGGGGASTGIETALGRPVDVAINHDADAIAMHMVNHPSTKHYCEDVFHVDPREVTGGLPVGLAWFSPDCKHFSKAKGATPVDKTIRGLAWVAIRWAAAVRPRIIMLENVEEFETWGPVVDGKPCPRRKGETFELWKSRLQRLGYKVESRCLRACDYGAPTIRKRFFLVARCDGMPIIWPKPTHGDPAAPGFKKSGLKKWRTAADIIDWSLPCPSIFGRRRPLAENTMRRIARGIQRFVLENPKPFIVTYYGPKGGEFRGQSIHEPLRTQTTENRFAMVAPMLVGCGGRAGQSRPRGADEPLATVTGKADVCIASAFLAKHYGGNYQGAGAELQDPLPTVTATDHNALVTSHLLKLKGTCRDGQPVTQPLHTVQAGGQHYGEVRAFLLKYYGTNIGQPCDEPLQTITTKHRFGLVTIHGEEYQIVDIGMRMLEPHELFAAQGFPKDYVIDVDASGLPSPKYKQVARCGNSVCPPLAAVLVRANYNAAQHQEVA